MRSKCHFQRIDKADFLDKWTINLLLWNYNQLGNEVEDRLVEETSYYRLTFRSLNLSLLLVGSSGLHLPDQKRYYGQLT